MKKYCVVCNKEFETKKNAKKTCSDECRIIRRGITDTRKIININVKCLECGGQFTGNKENKYCSTICKKKSMKKNRQTLKNICRVCNKTFESKTPIGKYCSKKCAAIWRKENPRHENECLNCKCKFKTNDNKKKYCSLECSIADRSVNPIVTCKFCKKEFRKKTSNAGKYCSRDCFLKHIGASKWESKQKIRDISHIRRAKEMGVAYEYFDVESIFDRDNWTCKLCGCKVNKFEAYPSNQSASLDHIVPLSKGGTHTPGNVQLAHLICNLKKSDK